MEGRNEGGKDGRKEEGMKEEGGRERRKREGNKEGRIEE